MTAATAAHVEPHVDALWEAVLDADECAAVQGVFAALEAGVDPEAVLLDVVGSVQRRVGSEWAADRLSVVEEHIATAINERVVAAVARRQPPAPPTRAHVVVACVDGEWHALPARLLAEVLRLRGFRVDFLGAQIPTQRLVAHLHRTAPDAPALSGSIATRLPAAHATIAACRAIGIPVIAGGAAFGTDGRYARLLGAEAWAPDARAAADRLAHAPLARPGHGAQVVDDLPHLEDQEYTMVLRTVPQLVRAMYTGLELRSPAALGYTDEQREAAAGELEHLVQFLATALYTGDPDLFGHFLAWTVEILQARGVPPASLVAALDVLADELHDFARASVLLRRARAELAVAVGAAEEGTGA